MAANFFLGMFNDPKEIANAPDVMMSATDQLSERYTAMAKDASKSSAVRDAAMNFTLAEGFLEDSDNFDECLKSVSEALSAFQSAKEHKCATDCTRLKIHALRSKAENFGRRTSSDDRKKRSKFLDEAEELAVKSRDAFKAANDACGEAAMLLSLAEINMMEGRGTNKRNEAVEAVFSAEKLISNIKDVKIEAAVLFMLIEVHTQSKKLQEARAACDKALALCQKAESKKELGKAWHMRARTDFLADAIDDALKASNEALRIFKELGLKKLEACEGFAIAQQHLSRSKSFAAMQSSVEALNLFKQTSCSVWTAQAFDQVVECYLSCGHKQEALRTAKDGLAHCVTFKDKRSEAAALQTLSHAHFSSREYKEALSAGEEAVDVCAALRESRWEAMLHKEVAEIHLAMGANKEAEKSAEEGVGLMQAAQDALGEASLLNVLAKVHLSLNDIAAATQAINEQRALVQRADDSSKEAASLLRLATLYSFEGKTQDATDSITEAREIGEKCGDQRIVAKCWNMTAELKSAQGLLEESLAAAEKMRTCLKLVGDQTEDAKAIELLCDLHIKRDNPKEAVKLAEDGSKVAKFNCDKFMQVRMWTLLSHAQAALLSQETEAVMTKNRGKAVKPATEALSLAKRLDDNELIGSSLYTLGTVHTLTGKASEAMPLLESARSIFQESGNQPTEIAVVMMMSKAEAAADDKEKAVATAKEAKALAEAAGDKAQAAAADALIDRFSPKQAMPQGMMMMAQSPGAAAPASGGGDAPAAGGAAAAAVAAAPEEKGLTRDVAMGTVIEVAKQIIGGDDNLDQDTALMDAGLDSLSALSFRQSLSNQVGLKLPASFIFDYPSVKEVADRIVELSNE